MSTWIRNICGVASAAIIFGVCATAAAALRTPNLHVSSTGRIYDASVGEAGWSFQRQDSVTGPIQANVERGAVLAYRYPGVFPDYELEATLYAAATTYADFGTNRAAIELNLRPVTGTDRGAYPAGNFSGNLPFNSTQQPNASTESGWTDTFVILGGTGVDTATVSVALHGHAQSRYGANGTIWYDAEPSFERFGTSGQGLATYNLIIFYDVLPPGFDNEGSSSATAIRREHRFSSPLPASVNEIGVQPEILTGSILFEYGVPFAMTSLLFLTGSNQINIDFDHTATLSMLELPQGASLISGSGHIYPTSVVPEPSTAALAVLGIVLASPFARGRSRRKCA